MPIADTQGLGSGAMNTRQEAPPRAWNKPAPWLCLTWETTLFQFVLTKHTSNFLPLFPEHTGIFSRGDMPEGFPRQLNWEFVYLSSPAPSPSWSRRPEGSWGLVPLQSLMNHQLPGPNSSEAVLYWVQNFHPQLFTDQSHFPENTFNCARRWNFRVSIP